MELGSRGMLAVFVEIMARNRELEEGERGERGKRGKRGEGEDLV